MNDKIICEAFSSSEQPQPVFVAVADILGFKNRIATEPLLEVRNDYENLLFSVRKRIDVTVISPIRAEHWVVGKAIYSDSVFLWCNDGWEQVQTLLSSAAFLVDEALKFGWALRGAIAYGECIIDRKAEIFIGQPIIEAHLAEISQEWVGIGIHSSVIAHPLLGSKISMIDNVVNYEVPVKSNQPPLDYAVNWGQYSSGACTRLEELQKSAPKEDGSKFDNTIKYLTETCQGMHALS